MNEREISVAAPFKHRNANRLRQIDLIFYYTQDKKWMSQDKAKKLILIAEKTGLITKDMGGEYVLREELRTVKIPLGFRPTDKIFVLDECETLDPLEKLLEDIEEKTGMVKKDLVGEMERISKHFDNLIGPEAAIILLAKKYHVPYGPYKADLIKRIGE
ncbi:MAG TPA: DUF2240 family protein [Methanocorpusculum sp.]|nr:DUF2240 family protein [Methanocorpusculum sp.]HJJ50767.1 DUF2240 family protein [Methanocorpusculum sp.]HKL97528.1 DUF2240 family protein [Methanocorpusculum sp.]